MKFLNAWPSWLLFSLLASSAVVADDETEWAQVHADIEYVRTGTVSTQKTGQFTFVLKASLDQLLVRVRPGEGEKWPDYVLLDEYPRVGKLTGTITLTGEAPLDGASASVAMRSSLTSLEDLWIAEIKTQPLFHPGLGAEIRVNAKLKGTVKSDLPGEAGRPDHAIFLWPVPVRYDSQISEFVSEGSLRVLPPLTPRPKSEQEGMIYDLLASSVDDSVAGLGGLSAPAVGAVLSGTPEQWELALAREAKLDLTSGGEYSHRVKITLRLVPQTLPTPKTNRPE